MNIMEFVSIFLALLLAIVVKDLLVQDVKQILMNVNRIHVSTKEVVWMIRGLSDVSACQVIIEKNDMTY